MCELVEDMRRPGDRHAKPTVGHGDQHFRAGGAGAYAYPASFARMAGRVFQKIAQYPLKQDRIVGDQR